MAGRTDAETPPSAPGTPGTQDSSTSARTPAHVTGLMKTPHLKMPWMAPVDSKEEDENKDRGNWGNDVQFVLACLGYAIGLGNVWRFPYLMYQYGGGFLVAYWLILFFVAYPAYAYELMIGQFTSKGPLHVFRHLSPAFEGLGMVTIYLNAAFSIYYNAIFAYAIFYSFSAFGSPWKRCEDPAIINGSWNSPVCYTVDDFKHCTSGDPENRYYAKKHCYNQKNVSDLLIGLRYCVEAGGYCDARNKDSWKCSFKLQFDFTELGAAEFFPGITSEEFKQNCSKKLFTQWDTCKFVDAPFDITESGGKGGKLSMNLNHQGASANGVKEIMARAECLKLALAGAPETCAMAVRDVGCGSSERLEGQTDLWCATRAYCDKAKAGSTDIACVQDVVDPVESYSSAEFYTYFAADGLASQLGSAGFSYQLLCSLVFAWFLVFCGVYKGPKWIGKVVYLTAILPVIMIIILIFVSVGLEGHWEGVKYYVQFDPCKLGDMNMWVAALVQVYFSIGVGTGGMTTLASYNRFHNDVGRDSLIVVLSNCVFSFIGGFGTFGVIGYMAAQAHAPVPSVLRGSGTGLAFIVFAQATAILPGGEILAFFFYMMLCLLALDSEFGAVETVLTFLYDEFPALKKHRMKVTAGVCMALGILGIPFVSRVGMQIVDVLDTAVYVHSLPFCSFFSLVAVMWVYGAVPFMADMRMMVGDSPGRFHALNFFFNTPFKWYWLACWLFLAPITVAVMIGFNMNSLKNQFSDPDVQAGTLIWTIMLGLIPVMMSMMVGLLWNVCGKGLTGAALFGATAEWGPALDKHRTGKYELGVATPPQHTTGEEPTATTPSTATPVATASPAATTEGTTTSPATPAAK